MSWFSVPDSSFTDQAAFFNIALPNCQGLINMQLCRCITSLGPDVWKENTCALQMSSHLL